MIVRLHRAKKGEGWLWYLDDDTGVRHTFVTSITAVQTNQATGIEIVFLVFNLLIAWRIKED